MAIDDLKNKFFVLKNEKGCFCSKCGKKLADDSYIITKHQSECNITFENRFNAIDEKNAYGYAFRIINGKLCFIIYQLNLELISGFKDKYNGAKWKQVFVATFDIYKRNLIEKGLYNIDVWFKLLLEKSDCVCLNKYSPHDVIRHCFKSIPYIYSYGMFLDIYRQRGYKYNNINIEKIKSIADNNIRTKSKYKDFIDVFEHEIDDNIVLEMNVYKDKTRIHRVFISKDFYYCNENIDYNETFGLKGNLKKDRYQCIINYKTTPLFNINSIEKFNKKYPELMVNEYLNSGGENLFQIIMCPNYNKVIENLGKGGLGYISDNIESLKFKNPYGNNIKEIFGVNSNIIKIFNNKSNIEFLKNEDFEEFIKKIQSIQPAIFSLSLNNSALNLLYYNFTNKDNYYRIKGVSDFNKNELLKLTKAFCENNIDIFTYKDYIRMCKDLNAYPYGKIPNDISIAHEYISEIYSCHKDKILNEKFTNAVSSKEYLLFDSTAQLDKKDNIIYKEDKSKYRIIVPKRQYDLTKESDCLHHCVRTYIKEVANENTYILFLRKSDDINTPFATIEVKKDKTLIQLKAAYNNHAPIDAQKFVRQWAEKKGVIIKSYDFD